METTRQTQAARSQRSRDQIVQAAMTVFALKGYASSSMDDICMAAGCSKGGLYHHFPTKAAVLNGVVDRLSTAGALVPSTPTGDAALPPHGLGRILLEIWVEAGRDDALRHRLQTGYLNALDRTLQDPQHDGNLTTILRIGTLIQLLTRGELLDAGEIARRLGIRRAA